MDNLKGMLLRRSRVNPESGCWEWNGPRTRREFNGGYGRVSVNGKGLFAHRLSYEVHCEAIPSGLNVLHRCDNPGCINPEHLFLGTQATNIADMHSKGRANIGAPKLTERDVLAIRSSKGISQVDLANKFGISRVQLQRILAGKRWPHLKEIAK